MTRHALLASLIALLLLTQAGPARFALARSYPQSTIDGRSTSTATRTLPLPTPDVGYLGYGYDDAGRRVALDTKDTHVAWGYDAAGRATDLTETVAAPALRVGLDDKLTAVVPGQLVTYTLPLANLATDAADGATAVVVTATLPPGSFVTNASWTPPAGATGASYTVAGNVFTFSISGTVVPGARGSGVEP